MFDAINAEAIYRRQQVARDWRHSSGSRNPLRRNRATREVPDPAVSRRAPLVTPAHWG